MTVAQFLALEAALPIGSSTTFTKESMAQLVAELTTSVAPAPSSSTKAKANADDDLLTAREAAALLKMRPDTLYKGRYKAAFAVRVGTRSLRYSKARILKALAKGAIQ
ncbi:MAG: hypothetical protein H0U66_06625 [Gemmatimonadaceae bacterium]|nr:hypothetical protein [Gemmatimonadaceae bacterium]